MTVAVPSEIARTSPEAATAATAESLDDHENSAPATGCPFASVAKAASRNVSPATSAAAAGATATALTCWATVTMAVPDAEPAMAVIVVVPSPAAVTSPEASTAATDASPLAQDTAAPAIT